MKKITLILMAVACTFWSQGQMTPMSSIADSASLFEQYSATIRQQAIRHFTGCRLVISCRDWASGTYFITLYHRGFSATKKVAVQH
jgi:hypothetical protein